LLLIKDKQRKFEDLERKDNMVAKSPYAYNKNSFRKKVRGPPSLRPFFRPSPLGQKKTVFCCDTFPGIKSPDVFLRQNLLSQKGEEIFFLVPAMTSPGPRGRKK
jgi:hypothetical protein